MMNEVVYDVRISDAAKILDKSDRQVRRYVKNKRLKAKAARQDGHVKLLFNREELLAYKAHLDERSTVGELNHEIIADTRLIDGNDDSEDGAGVKEADFSIVDSSPVTESATVKYVLDTLREQIQDLRKENQDLHYQLEQRSGQVGFLQGKIETLQDEIKMLMPATKPEEQSEDRKPWYRRIFRRDHQQ